MVQRGPRVAVRAAGRAARVTSSGTSNWRLPDLKKEIKAKTLPSSTLLATTRDEFYEADYDAYAYARYLCYYLQEQGKLRFYKKFLADKKDLTGQASLAAVVGMDVAAFDTVFRVGDVAAPLIARVASSCACAASCSSP